MNAPTREDYFRTCRDRGASEDEASCIADGLMRAQARKAAGLPGWETMVHQLPPAVRERGVQLYAQAVATNPAQSPAVRSASGVQATLAYGILVGMLLAEGGELPSQLERDASREHMPELWAWLDSLEASR